MVLVTGLSREVIRPPAPIRPLLGSKPTSTVAPPPPAPAPATCADGDRDGQRSGDRAVNGQRAAGRNRCSTARAILMTVCTLLTYADAGRQRAGDPGDRLPARWSVPSPADRRPAEYEDGWPAGSRASIARRYFFRAMTLRARRLPSWRTARRAHKALPRRHISCWSTLSIGSHSAALTRKSHLRLANVWAGNPAARADDACGTSRISSKLWRFNAVDGAHGSSSSSSGHFSALARVGA